MKKKLLLLLVGVCLTVVVWVFIKSAIEQKAKFIETARAINVLNKDLIKTMGEKPTIESVAHAQMLLDQQSPSIKQKIKDLLDSGRLRKYSDERIDMEEVINQNITDFVDYYEKFANVGRDDLENVNDLKSQYISAEFNGTPTKDLRTRILQKTDQVNANYDVIKAIEGLMGGLKSIYIEVQKEDEENV